ncbi:Os10g0516350, partial [Oryza sativa Japonica Group]
MEVSMPYSLSTARTCQMRRGLLLGAYILLPPLRDEFIQRSWLEHVPRQYMRTDFGALLEDADGEVGVGVAAELLQPDGRGEPRGPSPHDHHVVAHRLPAPAQPPRRRRRRAPPRRAVARRVANPRRRRAEHSLHCRG